MVAKSVQAASGLIMLVFVGMHLGNTALAPLGPEVYDGVQRVLRMFYQAVVVELILALALLAHIGAAVTRMIRERNRRQTPRGRWHRIAGLFLLLVIFGHIAAVRGPSLLLGIYPGFLGIAFSVDYAPAYFYPYYFLLGLAGGYHALNGALVAFGRLGLTVPRMPLGLASAGMAVAMIAALLGLGGWLFPIEDPYGSAFAKLALEIVDELTGGG